MSYYLVWTQNTKGEIEHRYELEATDGYEAAELWAKLVHESFAVANLLDKDGIAVYVKSPFDKAARLYSVSARTRVIYNAAFMGIPELDPAPTITPFDYLDKKNLKP